MPSCRSRPIRSRSRSSSSRRRASASARSVSCSKSSRRRMTAIAIARPAKERSTSIGTPSVATTCCELRTEPGRNGTGMPMAPPTIAVDAQGHHGEAQRRARPAGRSAGPSAARVAGEAHHGGHRPRDGEHVAGHHVADRKRRADGVPGSSPIRSRLEPGRRVDGEGLGDAGRDRDGTHRPETQGQRRNHPQPRQRGARACTSAVRGAVPRGPARSAASRSSAPNWRSSAKLAALRTSWATSSARSARRAGSRSAAG